MIATFVASLGGIGRLRPAPGTAGSLAAVAAGAALLAWHPAALWLGAAAAVGGGWWAVRAAGVQGDPGWVVIDEVAGQWIALLPLARPTWPGLLAAFALFRLFDIAKPGPVGWADRQPGAFGIMADDVVAGALAALVLLAATRAWP